MTRFVIRASRSSGAMEFPEPVIELAVEPKDQGDQEKMGIALKLAAEDPSFRVSPMRKGPDHYQGHGRASPRHSRRPHASGDSRLKQTSARLRWRIARPSQVRDIDYTHKKQSGGTGQFAQSRCESLALANGPGFEARLWAVTFRRNISRRGKGLQGHRRQVRLRFPDDRLRVHAV